MSDGLPGTAGRRRVYLMRHGAVRYYSAKGERVADPDAVPLTAEGREQSDLLGTFLAEIPFDLALHTDLPRTRETAERVLGGRKVPLGLAPALREIRTGRAGDLPADRMAPEFTYGIEAADQPGARFARGESFAQFRARVIAGLTAILRRPGWTRLLLVAHGGTNRAILSWVTRGGLASMASFEQDTCCLNVFDIDQIDGNFARRYLRLANHTPYDPTKETRYLTTLETTTLEARRE